MTELHEDLLTGPVRTPRNVYQSVQGIHNDATAQKLGFRGGTVAGSVHMEQFAGFLTELFGRKWWESGDLSLYFKKATTDGEPVRVQAAGKPTDATANLPVWMLNDNGDRVCEGTAALEATGKGTALSGLGHGGNRGDVRIFAGVQVGERLDGGDVVLPAQDQADRVAAGAITEPLDWYTGESPWGGPIASPAAAVRLMFDPMKKLIEKKRAPGVGLYGAIELTHVAGPILLDQPYRITGEITEIGSTGKTEYSWVASEAHDADGRHVASLRMLSRVMKASSDLYESK